MPMLVLPDGSVLTWDATPTAATPVAGMSVTPPSDVASGASTLPPDLPTVATSPAPTPADVATALAKVPPRWQAAAMRFIRTLVAGCMAAFAVAFATAGGTIDAVVRDPQAFLVAIGTAVFMAIEKAVRWHE